MMTNANEWQGRSGDAWAAEWRRTDRGFAPLTEQLLLRTRGLAMTGVLDIGCGAGELSLALARGRPHIRVVGVDISPALVETARERGVHLDNVSFEVADAARWRPGDDMAPDLLISRHGVMFFDDPVAAFANLREASGSAATLLFSCFRDAADNPFFTEMARLLPEAPAADRDAPGPFAFADRGKVERILNEAGWSGVTFEPVDFAMVAGAGEDPVDDAMEYFTHIGPAARALREMPEGARERTIERIRAVAERNRFETIVSLRAAAWIVTAR